MTTDMSTDEALVIGVSTAQPVSEGVGPGPGLLDLPQAFAELRSCSEHARPQLRTWLVESQLPLVEQLARGFRDRGEPLDDLVQVGTIGLLKAIDRFDPHRGVDFPTYATPTIVGEIKRHFRDRGWSIRVPRRLQEMRAALREATAVLSQRFGRSPTISELAGWLEVREETVLEGLESANAYATVSLDAPDSSASSMLDGLGGRDEALTGVEQREALRPLVAQLDARERQILFLRYFGQLTQAQIADEVGLSQMHVSRLLSRILARLRAELDDDW